jgi:hypothetical protein
VKQFRDEALAHLRATGSDSPEIGMLEMMTKLAARMGGLPD